MYTFLFKDGTKLQFHISEEQVDAIFTAMKNSSTVTFRNGRWWCFRADSIQAIYLTFSEGP